VADVAELVKEARRRHGLTQAALARRARTDQRQISRIETGRVSPSAAMLARLLEAMGERLTLGSEAGPRDNRSDAELTADYRQLSASERIARTVDLSRTLTTIAAGRQHDSR
jgi:transcriptional regulator with XRE-family HTH domain